MPQDGNIYRSLYLYILYMLNVPKTQFPITSFSSEGKIWFVFVLIDVCVYLKLIHLCEVATCFYKRQCLIFSI